MANGIFDKRSGGMRFGNFFPPTNNPPLIGQRKEPEEEDDSLYTLAARTLKGFFERGRFGNFFPPTNNPPLIGQRKEPEEEDDSLYTLAARTLKGFFERGEQHNPQTFDQYFRTTTSPARNILSNALFGASSALTGQKFRGVRDRKHEEWLVEQQRQAQLAQQKQQKAFQAAQIATGLQERKLVEDTRKLVEDVRTTQDAAERLRKVQEFDKTHGLNVGKFMHELEKYNASTKKFTGKLLPDAQTVIKNKFLEAGLDVNSPEIISKIHKQSMELANKIFVAQEAAKAANRYVKPELPKITVALSPLGTEWQIRRHPRTGKLLDWPQDIPVPKRRGVEIDRIKKFRQVIDDVRYVHQMAMSDPEMVGSWEQVISPGFRAFLGRLSWEERMGRMFLNDAVAMRLLAISGVAVSATERETIMQGLPKFFEEQDKFLMGTASFYYMSLLPTIRDEMGIDTFEVPVLEVMHDVMMAHAKSLQDGETFELLDPKKLAELAAKRVNRNLVYDPFGQGFVIGTREKRQR